MRNHIRRNRNIGTSKQGHGQDNELTIPWPASIHKTFYERLSSYQKFERTINGDLFQFVVEETRSTAEHACTINEIVKIVQHIPKNDYQDLNLIVLRQPKRKEETLSPVWGRLIYYYEFEGESQPAIILEAIDYQRSFKWSKKLDPDAQRELERIKKDGHTVIETKRYFEATYELMNVRNTQLYRTLLHEFGHYKHYLQEVESTSYEGEPFEEWEKRYDNYFKISTPQKEQFAHKYANELASELRLKGIIPFERID